MWGTSHQGLVPEVYALRYLNFVAATPYSEHLAPKSTFQNPAESNVGLEETQQIADREAGVSDGRRRCDSHFRVLKGTLSQTFDTPGIIDYFCEFHANMKGTIVVQ